MNRINSTYFYSDETFCKYGYRHQEVKIPKGANRLEVKPQTYYYHYSNPDSQGALIGETSGFPDFYFPSETIVHSAYSDRLRSWDSKRYDKACKLFGSYEQGWAQRFESVDTLTLKKFAKILFKMKSLPYAVRLVHYYNVSSGYSCPVVIALEHKKKERKA